MLFPYGHPTFAKFVLRYEQCLSGIHYRERGGSGLGVLVLDCACEKLCEALGQLGQDEPASGCRWSHCSGSTAHSLGQTHIRLFHEVGAVLEWDPLQGEREWIEVSGVSVFNS